MTQPTLPSDSNPKELWLQPAQPKLYIPGVTQARQPKLRWNNNRDEIDILTSRLADEADEFFRR